MTDEATWYDDQVPVVAEALKEMFVRLEGERDGNTIVGAGVISDPSDFTLTVALGTAEHVAAQERRYVELGIGDAADAAVDCLWNPGEWDIFALPEDYDDLPLLMVFAHAAAKRGDPDAYFDVLARALAAVHRDGFFGRYPNSVRVLNVVDVPFDEAPFEAWTAAMNAPEALDSYRRYVALNS